MRLRSATLCYFCFAFLVFSVPFRSLLSDEIGIAKEEELLETSIVKEQGVPSEGGENLQPSTANVEEQSQDESLSGEGNSPESGQGEEAGEDTEEATPIDLISEGGRHTGDIVQLWEDSELQRTEVMRNALKPDSDDRWIRIKDADGYYIIPYVITGQYAPHKRAVIERAMKAIADNSCVRFRPRNGEYDYVDIQNKNKEGCYTIVGRVSGQNVLMLEDNRVGTCLVYQTVIHELLHKVGLWHEQMRFDRDKYLNVIYSNISSNMWPQFRRISESESHIYGVQYDYRSVMHYDKFAFGSGPRKITMRTIPDPTMEDVIGKATDASEGDWTKICSIYQCKQCRGQPFGSGSGSSGGGGSTDANGASGGNNGGGGGGAPSGGLSCPSGLIPNSQRSVCQGNWLRRFPILYERLCCVLPSNSNGIDNKNNNDNSGNNNGGNGAGPSDIGGCKPKPECGTVITKAQPALYMRDCCDGCDTCRPKLFCVASDKQRFPRYWEINCCGRCGDGWRSQWCSSLTDNEKEMWRQKGLC